MVTVSGRFSVSKTGASAPAAAKSTSTLEASYLLFDHCENAVLSSASGAAQLPGNAGMHVKPSLTGASMHSALFSADSQTEALIPTTIDVVWTGVGDISRYSATGHYAGEDYFYNGRYISAAREAATSGTVTFGSITYDVTQAVQASAYIGTINSGLVVPHEQ